MDHRTPRCPQFHENGHHDEDACDICSIDSHKITEEQLANATLIAAAPELLESLLDAIERMDRARRILSEKGNWGMLETSDLKAVVAKATESDLTPPADPR